MRQTTVYFVRHAESDGTVRDDLIRPLTAAGLAAAAHVTAVLADRELAAVYASPYHRAAQTVAGLAAQRGLTIAAVDDFRERRIGVWLDDFSDFARRQWADFTFRLPDGESLAEVQARNLVSLRGVVAANRGRAVAIGTHGTALATILNAFDPTFGYDDFCRLTLPDIHVLTFDDNGGFVSRTRLAPPGAVNQR